ncbi:hypothetical protein WA158_007111 [Blastocystis sp. Blastoise]
MDSYTNMVNSISEYIHNVQPFSDLPLLTLSYAQSLDGSISSRNSSQLLISSSLSMKLTHFLRTIHQGIVVGINTIKSDNPSLTCRYVEGSNPIPIIIDSHLSIPLTSKVLDSNLHKQCILFCQQEDFEGKQERMSQLLLLNIMIIECPKDINSNSLDILYGFKQIKSICSSIFIEGGAQIITYFIQHYFHFISTVIITIAPFYVGGYNSIQTQIQSNNQYKTRNHLPEITIINTVILENDIVLLGKPLLSM